MLVDPALNFGLPAFLTPKPGLNSGFMIAAGHGGRAGLPRTSSARQPCSIDSTPTSANQEDHVSMAAHAARRLSDMADNLAAILGIELLAAAQGCDFHAPLRPARRSSASSPLLREQVPHLGDDRYMRRDIAKAAALVDADALPAVAIAALQPIRSRHSTEEVSA